MPLCHTVLCCALPLLDIDGYSAILQACNYAWALRSLIKRPNRFTWLSRLECLPIPILSRVDGRSVQLDVRPPRFGGMFSDWRDCGLDLYDPVVYHISNARWLMCHTSDFRWLVKYAHFPRIRFPELQNAAALCEAVDALVAHHCTVDDNPHAIRSAGLKATALTDNPRGPHFPDRIFSDFESTKTFLAFGSAVHLKRSAIVFSPAEAGGGQLHRRRR